MERKLVLSSWLTIGTLCVAACVNACGGDDDDDDDTSLDASAPDSSTGTDSSTQAPAENVVATITYDGAQRGPLVATLFTSNPPAGPPSGVGSNENPTLPGSNTVTFKNIAPGTYYAFSYVMVGPEHRQGPNPTDPNGASQQFTVTADGIARPTVTLRDPAPADGGSDAATDDAGGDAGVGDAGEDGSTL